VPSLFLSSVPVLEELILVGSRSLGPLGINLGTHDEEFATWERIMEFVDASKEIAIGTMGVWGIACVV